VFFLRINLLRLLTMFKILIAAPLGLSINRHAIFFFPGIRPGIYIIILELIKIVKALIAETAILGLNVFVVPTEMDTLA
jgi:hypothetical protein